MWKSGAAQPLLCLLARPGADSDGDGLIEVSSLAQLNAVRWDLDSDGISDNAANNSDYNAAFPVPASGAICSAGASGESEGACVGYELTADLDFDENNDGKITSTDATYWNGGEGWDPIGGRNYFTGVFDGGGFAIANLHVNRPSSSVGLFDTIAGGGEVRNLGLAGVDVTGDYYAGGLAGINNGTISGSYAAGTVSGNSDVGGLAGRSSGVISESYAAGTVSGNNDVGGLVGNNNRGTISESYAAGTVSGGSNVGGIVGYNRGVIRRATLRERSAATTMLGAWWVITVA